LCLTLSRISLLASSPRALTLTLLYQGLVGIISPSKSHSSSHPFHGSVNPERQLSKIYLGI
jgi:hypothetical protein